MSKSGASASHMELLTRIFSVSKGDVLELGAGYFSTTLLHWLSEVSDRWVLTVESDPKWYNRIKKYQTKNHDIKFVNDYDELKANHNWGLVFIDMKPAERRGIDIERFKNKADYIVIHDTEPEKEDSYQLSNVLSQFKYRYDYTKYHPWTTVVSNTKNLKKIE